MRITIVTAVCLLSCSIWAENDGYILTNNERTLEKIEQVYWNMPPVNYTAPADRWTCLPRTRQRFRDGGTLKVVMLGDSIVNDTSRSCWNLLLEREYLNLQIKKITCVRGSTGCWWYKEPGRVQRFVLDHTPELVVIGGISQRDDVDSIRSVIRQIREKSQTDILLITGAFGSVDPYDPAQWQRIYDANHYSDYRQALENLALETGSAFLDMELAWAQNIRRSGRPLDSFKRDLIHANEQGEQTLGRILATYLSPEPRDFILRRNLVVDPLVTQKLRQFSDWKFGFMMHWGIYSQWECIESWPLVEVDTWARPDDLKVWIERGKDMERFSRDYVALNKTFNPQNFQPEHWAAAAKDAGMKYLVFTTKHHDGFCLFDTKNTDYRTTHPSCPFHTNPRADVVRAVFDAFRKEGFGIGAYYSKSDWRHPGYWAPEWEHKNRNVNYAITKYPDKWKTFTDFTYNIIEELMSQYGLVDMLWLDGGQVRPPAQDIHMPRIAAMARSHQPGLIIVDRTVGGKYENYRTPEQEIPDDPVPFVFESCLTMGKQWSYRSDDDYKSTRQLIHMLVDIVSKGGNFLLNVGPDADGNLPEPARVRMKEIGQWMRINGEAIYGTRTVAPYKLGNVCFTQKADAVYAIYLEPEDKKGLPNHLQTVAPAGITSVQLLGSDQPIPWVVDQNLIRIMIPETVRKHPPCTYAFVFKFTLVKENP
jgi:alpha-L-fucosidase